MMCASVAIARTTSTIIINDNNSDNYMRQRKFVHNHNDDPFGVNESSNHWQNKLSTPNYPNQIDTNQTWTNRRSSNHFTSINWINNRWDRTKRATKRSLPSFITNSHTKHDRTNLNVMSNGIAVIFLVFQLKFIQDMAKASANGTVIPEHNMSLHPYFNFDVQRNVTARVGQTAFLQCKVEQLGDKSVSWIRKRDLHILTAGVLTYTSDERFQVIRPDRSDRWTLQIKFPQLRDSGIYECQVNTEPKMSMAFRLNVVEAKAVIPGPSDIYVKQGSEVVLTCTVSQGPHELGQIFWLRGNSMIDPKTSYHLNDIFEYPDRITISTESSDVLQSRLTISTARLTDSGNYSCMPTNAEGTSAIVHVINGEHPAAMQRGCANNNINLSILLYILSLSLLIQYLNRILSTFIVLHVVSPHRNQIIMAGTSHILHDVNEFKLVSDASKRPSLNFR